MSDDGAEPERAFRIRLFLLAGAVLCGDLISKGLAQAWLVPERRGLCAQCWRLQLPSAGSASSS